MALVAKWGLVTKSPPSRGRGLKPVPGPARAGIQSVAPFTGAWIET